MATTVEPKVTTHSDPSSHWTAALKDPAFFAYSTNYMIDTDHAVIIDVEASRSIRQVEVDPTRTILVRVKERSDLHPERLKADTACESGQMFGWLNMGSPLTIQRLIERNGREADTRCTCDIQSRIQKKCHLFSDKLDYLDAKRPNLNALRIFNSFFLIFVSYAGNSLMNLSRIKITFLVRLNVTV